MCLKYILFSNFISINRIECIDKIRIEYVAKKRKNKKLTAIDLMIIITQEKGINVGMYLTLCDFEKLNLRILWGSIV